ncbi:hypothetical protein L6R29_11715 [Myxococcota bacterium]|nr:hypothetical protein [Myxococcota bacterium]
MRPPAHMLDPALEPMSIRPELETLLKKMAHDGSETAAVLHLFGKNYPIHRIEHLRILLDKNLIREDAPVLHQERGRWMEARHIVALIQHFDPEKTPRLEEQISPTGRSEQRPSHADLILAARLGREAEQAASRGEIERAIEIYQQVLQLNERYPLVQKRLRELGRLLEERGQPSETQDPRHSPGTLPLPKPPPSSQSNSSPFEPKPPPEKPRQDAQRPAPSNEQARSGIPVRVAPPSSEPPRLSSQSSEQPRIRPSSSEPLRLSSQSSEQPRIRPSSSEPPRLSSQSSEQPRIRSSNTEHPLRSQSNEYPPIRRPSDEHPRIRSQSNEYPPIRSQSNEYPPIRSQSNEYPPIRRPSDEPQPRTPSQSSEQPRIRPSSTEQPHIPLQSSEPSRISSQSSEHPRVKPPARQASSGQMGTLPLPRQEGNARQESGRVASPLEQVEGIGIYRGESVQHGSPFIPQQPPASGSQGMFTPIPRPSSTPPPPRPPTGFGGSSPQGAGIGQPSAFSLPQDAAQASPRVYPPPIVEDEEPTQMAPLGHSQGEKPFFAEPSNSPAAPASSFSSPFGAAPPPEAARYPMIVEDEEPTQMSGFLFADSPASSSTPLPSTTEEAPLMGGMPEAAWSAEPLASWRIDEGSEAQPWQRIHCHQPIASLEVQVDRLYALLEGGFRVVSYRFPGGQPIAECTLPSVGTMLLATASGLAVLHAQEAMFSLWDRSNLSGIVQVPVGKMPMDMALLSRNQVLVANCGDGTLSLIDLQRGAEAERFHVGGAPCKILQHPRHLLILHQGYPQITLWPLTGPARN